MTDKTKAIAKLVAGTGLVVIAGIGIILSLI